MYKWNKYNKGLKTANEDGTEANFDYEKDLNKDVRIVVARPFTEHTMHNVIMAVSGRDTGATLFGPADMQLSANTQVKTIEGYACLFELTHTQLPSKSYIVDTRSKSYIKDTQEQSYICYSIMIINK